MEKIFYRVGTTKSEQGLWYDFSGNFTGLIHDRFDFCNASELPMDFDPELVGFVSAVPTLAGLHQWFPVNDIKKLQEHDYRVHIYRSSDYKFYERYQHDVIDQQKSSLIKVLSPEEYEDYLRLEKEGKPFPF